MKLEKTDSLRVRGKLWFAVLAVMCCLAAQAASYYWNYEGEGNWGDVTKWHKGDVSGPTGELPGREDDVAIYSLNTTINVDTEYEVATMTTERKPGADGRICTFKGNGKLIIVSRNAAAADKSVTSIQINDPYTVVMDGPDIYCKRVEIGGTVQYCEGGTLIVKKGTYTPVLHYLKSAPGRLVIDGGKVTSYDADTGTYLANRGVTMQNGWTTTGDPLCFIDLKSGILEARTTLNVGTFTMTGGVWDRSKVAPGTFFSTMLSKTNLYINIEGGEKVVFSPSDGPSNCDTRFFVVDEIVHNASGVNSWTPIHEDGSYSFGRISTPNFTFKITNNVDLAGRSLDVRNLEMSTAMHEAVLNVATVKVNSASANMIASSTSFSAPLHVYSPEVVRFESATAGSVTILNSLMLSDAYWRFHRGIDVSTTADDGSSAVNYTIGSPFFDAGATVDLNGAGNVTFNLCAYTGNGRSAQDGFSNQLERISFKGGGKLEFYNWSWNARDYPYQTERLALGPGCKLQTIAATYAHLDANEVEMDASNELIIKADSQNYYYFPPSPIMTGPRHVNDFQTPESRPKVSLTTAIASNEWNFAWINGQPVFWFTNVSQRANCGNWTYAKMSKWRGTVDGDWSKSSNWLIDSGKVQAENPLEQAMVFDGGYTNTRVTVDNTVQAYLICVLDKTAPVAFVGNGVIELGSTNRVDEIVNFQNKGCTTAIGSSSDHPVVFDVPVSLSDTITRDRYLTVTHNGRGYIAFMKSLNGGTVLSLKGDIRIGGTATAQNVSFNAQNSALPAKRTRLSVIPGGSFTLTRQTWLQYAANVEIHVYSNATFAVENPSGYNCCWGVNVARRPIWVKEFGKFDCRAPLGGTGKVSFKGKGEVRLADTGSRATADYPVELEDVTFAIDSFTTGHPIVLKGSPTWAAKTDWTYALGAVGVPSGETLTVDTGDLDTGVGHSVAINSALSAEKLVKKGAGTLTLGSSGNSIGEVSVEAGTLSIAASQSFDSLTVASGAGLQIASGVTVALSGSVDLTDVMIAAAAGKNWTTILTVPEGSTITGVQADDGQPFMMRVVESGTGLALQMRRRPGTTLSLR